MTAKQLTAQDPRMREAATELQELIARQFPKATFDLVTGQDPEGVYLTAIVDTDDLTSVLGTVDERLVELQVDQGLPLYVVPVRPPERVMQDLRQPQPRVRPGIDVEASAPPLRP